MIELSIKVSNVYQRYSRRFDIDSELEPFEFKRDNATIAKCVDETVKDLKGLPEDIRITATMQYQ